MPRMFAQIALLSAVLSLTGCLTFYVPPTVSSGTTLTLHVNNEFTAPMMMKTAIANTYASLQCENPRRLGSRIMMKDQDMLPPVSIAAGQPFVFGIHTSDGSPSTRNTGCSVTAAFNPLENEAYQATLSTKDDKTCSIEIRDKNNVSIPFKQPEFSCDETLGGIVRNGTGYFYNPRMF